MDKTADIESALRTDTGPRALARRRIREGFWWKATAGTLPYGLRKRVELARAMALEPKLILLDEPMAGMNFEEKEDMARYKAIPLPCSPIPMSSAPISARRTKCSSIRTTRLVPPI